MNEKYMLVCECMDYQAVLLERGIFASIGRGLKQAWSQAKQPLAQGFKNAGRAAQGTAAQTASKGAGFFSRLANRFSRGASRARQVAQRGLERSVRNKAPTQINYFKAGMQNMGRKMAKSAGAGARKVRGAMGRAAKGLQQSANRSFRAAGV